MSKAFRDAVEKLKVKPADVMDFAKRFGDVDCSDDLAKGNFANQSDAAEVNINNIIKRAEKTGYLPEFRGQPFYGDVSEFNGLADAFQKVQESKDLFMTVPANVRERFENDPIKYVEFLADPANLDEAVKLGLAIKRPDLEPASTTPAPGSDSPAQ